MRIELDKDEVTFGRLPTCTAVLDSRRAPQMISRLHGFVRRRSDAAGLEWLIVDNKSLNGIMVNGTAVAAEGQVLRAGDVITFGRVMAPPEFEYIFEVPETRSAVEDLLDKQSEAMKRVADLQHELEREREQHRTEQQQRRQECQKRGLDVGDLSSELVCSVCQDWLVHAATVECSHSFCSSCIDAWLLTKKFECPVCRAEVVREPVRSRALDSIVLKAVGKLDQEAQKEFDGRVAAADKALAKAKKLHDELERSVNDALKKGKAFFHIDSSWSRRERELFMRGVKDYTGETRETYCKLTGLTVSWVHSANSTKLNQALHNLQMASSVDLSDDKIRQRLLMFLRYG